jgi:hypothetical protein
MGKGSEDGDAGKQPYSPSSPVDDDNRMDVDLDGVSTLFGDNGGNNGNGGEEAGGQTPEVFTGNQATTAPTMCPPPPQHPPPLHQGSKKQTERPAQQSTAAVSTPRVDIVAKSKEFIKINKDKKLSDIMLSLGDNSLAYNVVRSANTVGLDAKDLQLATMVVEWTPGRWRTWDHLCLVWMAECGWSRQL